MTTLQPTSAPYRPGNGSWQLPANPFSSNGLGRWRAGITRRRGGEGDDRNDVHDGPPPATDAEGDAEDIINMDDDDITVIELEQEPEEARGAFGGMGNNDFVVLNGWPGGRTEEEIAEEQITLVEQQIGRIQQSNFWYFLVLFLVPTSLLLVVIANAIQGDGQECVKESSTTHCAFEPRYFINAFTRRCICDTVQAD